MNWIKISERRPTKADCPLVAWNGKEFATAECLYGLNTEMRDLPCTDEQEMEYDKSITHWAPLELPSPPKPREWFIRLNSAGHIPGLGLTLANSEKALTYVDWSEGDQIIKVREILP